MEDAFVLYGATDTVIWQLQAVLHAAVRLITGIWRDDHITPTLRDTVHWLPVSQRITFKIALMTYDYPWPITSVLLRHLFTDLLCFLPFPASLC